MTFTHGRGIDLVVVNGRITDGQTWPVEYEAVAVHDGRIVGVGTSADVLLLAGAQTRVVDAGGRRVIPGLIDGHLHVVRTGLSYDTAVSWAQIRSLEEGLQRLNHAAARLPANAWLYVPGGWTEEQLAERRGPTREELDAVSGEHPAYVQCAYQYAVLNSAAMRLAGLNEGGEGFPEGTVDVAGSGVPTGRIRGVPAYKRVIDGLIGAPTLDQQVSGTSAFLTDLQRLGLVGAVDPGGFRTKPESYDAVNTLRRRDALDFRLRLYVHASEPGSEVEQTRQWVRHARPRSGDPFLQVVGIGEVVTYDSHDSSGYDPEFIFTPQASAGVAAISQLAADYGFALHAHAIRDESIGATIDAWETISDPSAIGRLRFSIAHGELIGPENLARLAAHGAGIGVQARMYDTGVSASAAWGDDAYSTAAPLGRIEKHGIPLGGGTDGAVGHTYNPWEALWWFVTGHSVGSAPRRAAPHRLSRERALDVYTRGSAWFSFEEHERGRIAAGCLADLAILDTDYFTVDEDAIPDVTAWATIVGGEIVHGPAS